MTNEAQTFNVLCVAEGGCVHQPSWAPTATLRTDYDVVRGVKIAKTVVQFGFGEYRLIGVRPGLSGIAVTLEVETDDADRKPFALYTDVPWSDHDTVEEVRRVAEAQLRALHHNLDDVKKPGWWPTS